MNSISKQIQKIIPVLDNTLYKGQCGKIGVIGGSSEYTGAPFYAAMSALKLGADLSYIICTKEAALPIKSYSPEIIVYPYISTPTCLDDTKQVLSRLSTLIIGPGLGRDTKAMADVVSIIIEAKSRKTPLVIDADGLWIIAQEPSHVQGYTKTILTPNSIEFQRLWKSKGLEESIMSATDAMARIRSIIELKEEEIKDTPDMLYSISPSLGSEMDNPVLQLSQSFDGVTIMLKGKYDIISDGKHVVYSYQEGSPRRCGGQGDVLSGTTGVFYAWAINAMSKGRLESQHLPSTILASAAASRVTRYASRETFKQQHRSMTTPDMINGIGKVMQTLYPINSSSSSSSGTETTA